MRSRRRQRGQKAPLHPRSWAPRAEEERQWKEEAISAAQAQPWRPSWERETWTNPPVKAVASNVRCGESLVKSSKPWRPSWERERLNGPKQLKEAEPNGLALPWQPCAVANLRRRIWASKRFTNSAGAEKLQELHMVPKCQDVDTLSQSDAKTAATTSLHSEAIGNESILSRDADVHSERSYSELVPDVTESAEEGLRDILARLQAESSQLHPVREWLFNTVRDAAEEALGENFERMALVGSVALQIDIPASDVDAVTFTKRPVDSIQVLHATATALRQKEEKEFNVQVISTARVPILVVSTADHAVRMDMSVNQKLPDEHARWVGQLNVFQQDQQIARDFLRSVKYWHSQRQIPGTKEGGYPALAWLFLALHVLNLHFDSEKRSNTSNQGLLTLLKEFFTLLRCVDGPDGPDGPDGTSKFSSWCAPPNQMQSFWPFPSIYDPVSDPALSGVHHLNQEISAATQLLYAGAFRRAEMLIAAAESGSSIATLFEKREAPTSLPVVCDGGIALILKAGRMWAVEPLAVSQVRGGWTAPFFHRCDGQSKVRARVLGINSRAGVLTPFPELRAIMDFTPSELVGTCSVAYNGDGERHLVISDLQLWQDMCQLLQECEPPTTPISHL